MWTIIEAERGEMSYSSEYSFLSGSCERALGGRSSPRTLSVCQASLALAKGAKLIGSWGPPSLTTGGCVCAGVCVCVCGWAACEPRVEWSSKDTMNSHLLSYFTPRMFRGLKLKRPVKQPTVNEAGPSELVLVSCGCTTGSVLSAWIRIQVWHTYLFRWIFLKKEIHKWFTGTKNTVFASLVLDLTSLKYYFMSSFNGIDEK